PMATTTIPTSHANLLQASKRSCTQLATVNAEGSKQVTPVREDYNSTNLIVNTARGRVKAKILERNTRVAMAIADPENPYRYLGVQGRVVEMIQQGADAHIDKMAQKYLNKDAYPYRQPGELRVMMKIAP